MVSPAVKASSRPSSSHTSDAAHSRSSTCVSSASRWSRAPGGGVSRRRRRSAAAVSSRAAFAPPAPAAASSPRIHAGASRTGKCFAMNAAALGRGRAKDEDPPPPPPPGREDPPRKDPSANPAGRKYPSEGFIARPPAPPPPRERNSAFSLSSRMIGRIRSSEAGCARARSGGGPGGTSARPSGSSAGGRGAPRRSDRGHIA